MFGKSGNIDLVFNDTIILRQFLLFPFFVLSAWNGCIVIGFLESAIVFADTRCFVFDGSQSVFSVDFRVTLRQNLHEDN